MQLSTDKAAPTLTDNNTHAKHTRETLKWWEESAGKDRLDAASIQATLALVEETRTASLVEYLKTLPPEDRHEGPAVLALVRQRLGLVE